jgi:signal transduction histidine kinase/CheY-like chemotaxis protein
MIKSLHGVPEDIGTKAYESIKRRLMDIRSVHPEVRFVYIYCQTDGKLYFMADSEPVESSDYSPPGQEYTEARDEDKRPFQDQMSVIQEPFTDRWGSWVSILVPMKDSETGKVIALFGMDYPADMWNIEAVKKTIQSVMIVIFLLLLVILFYVITNKNLKLDAALTNAEKAKVKANEMTLQAELSNKAKSTFLANMSHEIRTPLNAIIGFSQLMNRDPMITDSQKVYNSSIIRAGEHLLMLINDILELSKVEAGRVVLNPTNFDLQSLFADIQLIFKEQARTKHLQFIFETPDDLPQYVIVDENKLRQIFINLIGNAIKFTDEGGIAVRARVDTDTEDTYKLVVEIEDSGSGIPKNELSNLFKHFVQTSSGMNKASGTGLGLVLSRELARLMGGDITVASEEGKGSVFTFYVKIKKGTREIVEPNSLKRVISIDKRDKEYRILVVDDKTENLQVAVDLLRIVGFETNEAVNGAEAVKKFEEWDPDLILMDMRMPVMDGYEATRRIRSTEKGSKIPIVALTASTFEEEKNEIKSLDMHGYIRKPFKESELFSTIAKILDITYLYDNETLSTQSKFLNDDIAIEENIAKLPGSLVSDMATAVSVADLDQLIKLIKSIKPENSDLAQHLMTLARSYDYYQLQQILNKNIEENE